MRLFHRKQKAPPTKTEIENHRDALGFFLKRQTSLGMRGSREDLGDAQEAMYFFAYTDLVPTHEPPDA